MREKVEFGKKAMEKTHMQKGTKKDNGKMQKDSMGKNNVAYQFELLCD